MESFLPAFAFRTWLAVGGLAGLLGLEQLAPFKRPVDRRLARYGRNLFISAFNSVALEWTLAAGVVAMTAWLAERRIGLLHQLPLPGWAATLAAVVYLDFATYLFHWAYHVVGPMWRLHRVHHSDMDLDVTSASRFHLFEILLSTCYRIAIIVPLGPSIAAVAVFEATLLFFAQVQHANLRVPGDRWLRLLFVTPDMHRVHHSDVIAHTNSNYSTVFSLWDRLFGTYRVEGVDQASIRIGMPEYLRRDQVTLGKLLLMPFEPPCAAQRENLGPYI